MRWNLIIGLIWSFTMGTFPMWMAVEGAMARSIMGLSPESRTFEGGLAEAERTLRRMQFRLRMLYLIRGAMVALYAVAAIVLLAWAVPRFEAVRGEFVSQWILTLAPWLTAVTAAAALALIARFVRVHLRAREHMRFVGGRRDAWKEAYAWREEEKRLVPKARRQRRPGTRHGDGICRIRPGVSVLDIRAALQGPGE